MKAALEDPTAQKNRQMLTDNESTLLDQFISGKASLSSQYVQPILSILKKLSTDFNIEEITLDTLKTRFNRPLDVASAKEALTGIIDEIVTRQRQQGKKYEDIRIIIK
jgi:radical SAM superfamily enzyme